MSQISLIIADSLIVVRVAAPAAENKIWVKRSLIILTGADSPHYLFLQLKFLQSSNEPSIAVFNSTFLLLNVKLARSNNKVNFGEYSSLSYSFLTPTALALE